VGKLFKELRFSQIYRGGVEVKTQLKGLSGVKLLLRQQKDLDFGGQKKKN
jgi:hypothetical protein